MADPLLGPVEVHLLREAIAPFTVDGVNAALGPEGRDALARGDHHGAVRALRDDDSALATLVRLFVLGRPVAARAARTALAPLDIDAASALLDHYADTVRARFEVRPYADDLGGGPWWVCSDLGSEVTGRPLAPDHVLGIGTASVTLAGATPRRPARRSLDLGTGSGVQALHLARHSAAVTATDVSHRALRFAATTAVLSAQTDPPWDLREGSWLDPIAAAEAGDFDCVVSNPPFVVSPGAATHSYRDSGLAGDGASELVVRGVPRLLTPGGTASLLANWIVPADGDWAARVAPWVSGLGCAAWFWQRDVVDPPAYVTLWLRDAGLTPGSPAWVEQYDDWLDWFARERITAVGLGLVTLVRTDQADPPVGCDDVPQPVEQPAGVHVPGWFERQRWLDRADDALFAARLVCAPDVRRDRDEVAGPDGWATDGQWLRQTGGMRWTVEVDDAMAGVVAACTGDVDLALIVDLLAAARDVPAADLRSAAVPVVRDLVARGFLLPAAGSP